MKKKVRFFTILYLLILLFTCFSFESYASGSCAHTHRIRVNSLSASCEKDGYTGDLICESCGYVFKKGEVIPAIGYHTYKKGVCVVCGEKEPGYVAPSTTVPTTTTPTTAAPTTTAESSTEVDSSTTSATTSTTAAATITTQASTTSVSTTEVKGTEDQKQKKEPGQQVFANMMGLPDAFFIIVIILSLLFLSFMFYVLKINSRI